MHIFHAVQVYPRDSSPALIISVLNHRFFITCLKLWLFSVFKHNLGGGGGFWGIGWEWICNWRCQLKKHTQWISIVCGKSKINMVTCIRFAVVCRQCLQVFYQIIQGEGWGDKIKFFKFSALFLGALQFKSKFWNFLSPNWGWWGGWRMGACGLASVAS